MFCLLYMNYTSWNHIADVYAKVTQSRPTLCNPLVWPTRLLYPWDSPGKKTGVGCHTLLQGIFLTQGWNPGVLQTLVPSAPPGRHTHN